MINISIYITQEQKEAISIMSKKTGLVKSDIIRRAIDDYIGSFKKRQKNSTLRDFGKDINKDVDPIASDPVKKC